MMPGAGKNWTPPDHSHDPSQHVSTVDDIKTMRYRKGRQPTYLMRVRGVSREDERTFWEGAKLNHMSGAVFFHFLMQAIRDRRLLILPMEYDLDRLISERLQKAIAEEVQKRVLLELGDAGVASPWRG